MGEDLKSILKAYPGSVATLHKLSNGTTLVALQAEGGGSKNMEALSSFDKSYLSNKHGGNPVKWGLPIPEAYVIPLKSGLNQVPLIPACGVDQITRIKVERDSGVEADPPIEFVLEKSCFNPSLTSQHKYTTKNLMNCRTMFVPYRDALTKLVIHSPVKCTLIIN